MSVDITDLHTEVEQLSFLVKQLDARIGSLRRTLGAIPITAKPTGIACPRCGVVKANDHTLDLHLRDVHGDEQATERITKRDAG